MSYNSIDFEVYDSKLFNKWVDRFLAFTTGMVIGAAIVDLYPEAIPKNPLYQVGLAAIVEQGINGVQLADHYMRPGGRTWEQRLKQSLRDDPYRIAGIYVGQLAMRHFSNG